MSALIFPSAQAGAFIASREPYQDVRWDEAASGKEVGSTWQLSTRTKYKIRFDLLRSAASSAQELQQLVGMFLRHCRGDSFLLSDPEDSSVTDMGFGVGDGATTAFQMQRMVPGLITDAAGFGYTPQSKPYVNLVKNSSFETDTNADGLADSWGVYNSSALEPSIASIVPGMNGGKAQRVSWGTNNTGTKGITQNASSSPAFVSGQWYTVSWFVRAVGGPVGTTMGLSWNTTPSQTIAIANPVLSGSWQRYVFQVFWNLGVTVNAELFVSIANVTGGFGDIDFDLVQVVKGQHGVTEFQPIETPAAATATRTPSYWPAQSDGFEPVYELNGNPTLYQDGDWMGRRQLYPWTRTNLLPWSEAFDNAAWVKTNIATTANSTTAPDGTSNADTIGEGVVNGFHVIEQVAAAEVQGELRCYSVFVKANNLPNITLMCRSGNESIDFNLSTGVIDATHPGSSAVLASGVITSPLWPGWYRIWFVKRAAAVSPGTGARIFACLDGTYTQSYAGTSRTFFAWGAMSETVSNLLGPTPYIKTPSSAAVTVTDYSMGALAKPTLAAAPPSGAYLSADFSFFKRVRLADPGLGLQRIVSQMWSSGVSLITQRPLP